MLVAVKLTGVPAQMALAEGATDRVGVTGGVTVIVIVLLVAEPVAQVYYQHFLAGYFLCFVPLNIKKQTGVRKKQTGYGKT